MMKKSFWAGLLFVFVGFAASAQPQNGGGGAFPMQQADRNGDGKVSWAEVREVSPRFSQKRFENLDKNGDGMLSKADAPRRRSGAKGAKGELPQGKELIAILRRADADGDDRVTKEELKATAPRLAKRGFARLDTNRDGVISEADMGDQRKNGTPSPEAIRRADANGDGQWSYEELKTVAKRLPMSAFQRADGNGDGVLNMTELQALRRFASEQRGPRGRNKQPTKVRGDAIGKLLESDANDDGGVSFEELTADKPGYPRSAFDRNDRNGDGVISRADLPK